MGIDIDINTLVGKMQEVAKEIDKQGDKNGLINDEELSIFNAECNKLIAQGVTTAQEVDQIFGLEKSEEAKRLSSQATTTPVELSKKDTTRNQKAVKGVVEDLVKTGVHPNELVATLKVKFSYLNSEGNMTLNPEYAQMINDVETILGLVNATNYQSKDDVDDIHKTVKKQLKDKDMWKYFHQDVLKSLEEQAKKTQIAREFETLKDRYIEIKNTMANTEIVKQNGDNYKAYVEILKDQLQKKGSDNKKEWDKSYTKEAFEYVKNYAQQDAMIVAQARLDKQTSGDDNKEIKKEMETLNKSDDEYQDKAIKELKMDRITFGRKHTYEENLKELKNISREKLEKELGKSTFEKLNRSYLGTVKNSDGTYDLTQLAEAILSRAGADYTVSRNDGDVNMSELKWVGRYIGDLTGQEFSKSELKDLIDLSGIKYEHKDRSAKTIAKEAFGLPSVVAGAASGAILAPYVNVTQGAVLKLADETTAQEIIKQLTAQGISVDKTAVADGIALKIKQTTTINLKPLGSLAAVVTEAAIKGLWALAFGVDKNEKSCLSVSDYDFKDSTYTDPEKYKNHISQSYNNPQKVNAVHSLVDAYVQAYGKDWHTHFQQGLRDMAGIGSKLNPVECSMMKYQKVEIPTPQEPANTTPAQPVETPVTQPVQENKCDIVTRENIKLDGTNGNPNSAKFYWEELINMYYSNCLKENGGMHTMKEIRFQLRKINNIPNNYPSIPKGIVLPYDLFGDGSCERTEMKNVTLRKRVKSNNNSVRTIQMQDGGWNFGTRCPLADGSYGKISWNTTRYATKEEAERAGREAIGE